MILQYPAFTAMPSSSLSAKARPRYRRWSSQDGCRLKPPEIPLKQLYLFQIRCDNQLRLGQGLYFFHRPVRGIFFKKQALAGHLDHRDIGNDEVNAAWCGKWHATLFDNLGLAILRRVLRRRDHFPCVEGQIHATPDVPHTPPREHPVRQITIIVDFDHAQNCYVNMTAAYHGERVGMVEKAHAGLRRDILSAGIDQVYICHFLHVIGRDNRAETQRPVFRVVDYCHTLWGKARHEAGNTDAEVHYGAVEQLPGYPHGNGFAAKALFHPISPLLKDCLTLKLRSRWRGKPGSSLTSTILLTKIPGVTTWSGSRSPGSTTWSTSAMVTLAAMAIIGLNCLIVPRYTRFPMV